MENKNECVIATLVAKRKSGEYITYVFKISYDRYVMCTRLPNWNVPDVEIGQEGYLSYKFIQAGIDQWYDQFNKKMENYAYTANYFTDFVPISHVIDGDRIYKIDDSSMTIS